MRNQKNKAARASSRRVRSALAVAATAAGAAVVGLATSPAQAIDRVFVPASGNFNVATNWNPNGVPTAADNAIVNNGGTVTVSDDESTFDVRAGDAVSATGSWNQTSNTLTVTSWFRLGTANLSVGNYTINGGILNKTGADQQFNIGETAGGTGNMTVNTGGSLNLNSTGNSPLTVGRGGTGVMNIAGGTVNMAQSFTALGFASGSNGTMNISAGSFINSAAQDFNVGDSGTGTLTVSGTGTLNTNTGALLIARQAISTGTVNLNGGTISTSLVRKDSGTSTSTFNFNGGLLQARANDPAAGSFFAAPGTPATLRVNVRNGGAKIDSQANAITVAAQLQHSNVGGDNATDGGLTKTGAGSLTLSNSNTYTGATTVTGGTLAGASDGAFGLGNVSVSNVGTLTESGGLTNNYIADTATLFVPTGATVNLNYTGTDTVSGLVIGSTSLPAGVYGPSATAEPGLFSSTGLGTITVVPEPASVGLVALISLGALARRRRVL